MLAAGMELNPFSSSAIASWRRGGSCWGRWWTAAECSVCPNFLGHIAPFWTGSLSLNLVMIHQLIRCMSFIFYSLVRLCQRVTHILFILFAAFAWLKCERDIDDCESFLRGYRILARGGKHFGVSPKYVRVSMLDRDNNFNLFVKRLSTIQLWPPWILL